MIGACAAAAAVLAIGVLRPVPETTTVYVAAREIAPGEVITAAEVMAREIARGMLPQGELSEGAIVGRRAAVRLTPGTILNASLTYAIGEEELSDGERLIEIPVAVGASLAQPGMRVDVIATGTDSGLSAGVSAGIGAARGAAAGVAPRAGTSLSQPAEDGAAGTTDSGQAADTAGTHAAEGSDEGPDGSTDNTVSSNADGNAGGEGGAQAEESTLPPRSGAVGSNAWLGNGGQVLCAGARVIRISNPGERSGTQGGANLSLSNGSMVTFVTLAVPREIAPAIVWAATQDALGLALSP